MYQDDTEIADRVVKAVKRGEEQINHEILDGFSLLTDETLRNLRRNLPITRNKLDWDKVCFYRHLSRSTCILDSKLSYWR